MKKVFALFTLILLISSLHQLPGQAPVNRDTVMVAAHEIINETTYCGLVTMDATGQPQIRTMNPFPGIKDDFVVWFATSRDSRKVREIKANPKVCVYFANHIDAKGYVNINGNATVIDDKELLIKMKRDYWTGMPNWQEIFVLIKIIPTSVEVINYKHGLNNEPATFKAPSIPF